MGTKKTKKKKAKRSVHEMELGEIAMEKYWVEYTGRNAPDWNTLVPRERDVWNLVARAVLEEAIYRMEANINKE